MEEWDNKAYPQKKQVVDFKMLDEKQKIMSRERNHKTDIILTIMERGVKAWKKSF